MMIFEFDHRLHSWQQDRSTPREHGNVTLSTYIELPEGEHRVSKKRKKKLEF